MLIRLSITVVPAVALAVILIATSAPAAVTCTKVASPGAGSAQKLVDSLSAGQTGCLHAGIYVQGLLRFPKAGAAGSPITLTSYPGERATLSGGNVYVPAGSDFVTIRDVDIDGAGVGSPTVQIMGADTVLSGSTLTNRNTGQSCMLLGNLAGDGQAQRTVVSGNRFADCGNPADGDHDHGIYIENSVGAEVVDNLFWHAAAWAIQLYPNAQGTHIAHNVMDGSAGGIMISGEAAGGEYAQDYASSGTVIEQNLLTNASAEYNVQSWWGGPRGTGNVVRSNCVYGGKKGNIDTSGGGFTTSGNKTADPQYVAAPAHDYRLKAGSPCLAVVGYDTAAKLAGDEPAPDPTPTPTATPSPTPTATPSPTATPDPLPLPPVPTPPPLLQPAGAAPLAIDATNATTARVLRIAGPRRVRGSRPRFRVSLDRAATVHWTLRTGRRPLARGTRRVSHARTFTLRPRIAKRQLRRWRGHRMRLVVRTAGVSVSQ